MEQNPIREQLSPTRALNFRSLDAWRGAACLAVVFYHCWLEMSLRVKIMPVSFAWAQFGNLGVSIFFVISGFAISVAAHSAWHKRSFGAWVWARVVRIYPPLWAALLLVIALKSLASRGGAAPDAVLGSSESGPLFYAANFSLLNLVFLQPYLLRVAWSLCYEVAFYALVFAAMMACLRAKSARALLDVLHVFTLGVLVWLLLPFPMFQPPHFPFDLWPQFGAGVLVFDFLLARAQNEERRQRVLRAIGLSFATLALAFMVRCARSPFVEMRGYIAPFAVSLVFAALLCGLYRLEETVNRWHFVRALSKIGTFSYSIYLVHFTLIMALSRGVFSHFQTMPWFVEVALLFLISVGSGWGFYQMIEKPSHRWKRARK